MLKRSAGILVYNIENDKIKVLLCHFGGPYWEGKDIGAWSLSKGEISKGEKVEEAARREFYEETNLSCNDSLNYLATKKVSSKKIATFFYVKSDLKLDNCKSNTFKLEWPKDSGIINEFPEMDKYEWMDLEVAQQKIIPNQLFF